MLFNLEQIENNALLAKVKNLKNMGFRLAAVTCESEKDIFELTYHFDLNYEMINLRIHVTKEDDLLSISEVYPSAFLIENEFQDLYGLTFKNLTIDYQGRLYLTEDGPEAPMKKQ